MVPRKISLDALRVFESAARHLSFTKAAAELTMTQGAVSQRIQTLEARLGTKLFRRLTRALELSPDGERLYEGLHVGLARVEVALRGFRSSRDARALTLTVSSSLATRWLMRRASALARTRHQRASARNRFHLVTPDALRTSTFYAQLKPFFTLARHHRHQSVVRYPRLRPRSLRVQSSESWVCRVAGRPVGRPA